MPWFEPPSKNGCRDKFLMVIGVLAEVLFVAAVMYVAARAVA